MFKPLLISSLLFAISLTASIAEAQSGASPAIQIGNGKQITLPLSAKTLLNSEQAAGTIKIQNISFTVLQSKDTLLADIGNQLKAAGIKSNTVNNNAMGRFTFTVNGGPPSSITVTTANDGVSAVSALLMIPEN